MAEPISTAHPRPATTELLRSLLRPSAFKLTLLWTLGLLTLRRFESGISGSAMPVLKTFEHALGDLRFRERLALGLARSPEYVVIVAADERSIEQIGFWPWPRTTYAALIDKLTDDGASAIVFDIAFMDRGDQFDQHGNEALAAAIRRSKRSVQAFILLREEDGADAVPAERQAESARRLANGEIGPVRSAEGAGLFRPIVLEKEIKGFPVARAPIAEVAAASVWFGFFNGPPDDDGVLRRIPLVARLGGDDVKPSVKDHYLPSIDVAGFAIACGTGTPKRIFPLAAADAKGFSAIDIPCMNADAQVPVDPDGNVLLDYQVPWTQLPQVSTVDVLNGLVATDRIGGKIALVAATGEGTHDNRSSPLNSSVPGGVTHATALEQMVSGRYLKRPADLPLIELLLLLAIGLGFGWLFATLRPLAVIGALLVGLIGTHLLTLGAFLAGYDTVSALPLFLLFMMALTALPYRYFTEESDKRFIRSAFGHYLSPSVLDAVLADPKKLGLGGEKREMTVLFSDVRGFTSLSEQLQPEQLVTLLNQYLTPMTDLVFEFKGTLDKYMGDAIMAFFGAPLDQADHALNAVKTADAMMKKLAVLVAGWRAEGLPPLDIGIGISTGQMVVGNMGSANGFRNYTVMGDVVNLGSRLEGTNKVYGTHVILSEETEKAVRGQVTTRLLDAVRVKGKLQPVRIYELIAVGPAPAEWQGVLDDYQRAVELYRQRDFEAALPIFERVLSHRPGDKPSEIYLARCQALRLAPPPETWDGVSDLLTK